MVSKGNQASYTFSFPFLLYLFVFHTSYEAGVLNKQKIEWIIFIRAIILVLVLALPNFTLPFAIKTDTFGFGFGEVLSQNSSPVAFFS